MIVPMTVFSCYGRITGYLISLWFNSSNSGNPAFQVFRPRSSSTYREICDYSLQDGDITDMGNYHLANVSFTENDRVNQEILLDIIWAIPQNIICI